MIRKKLKIRKIREEEKLEMERLINNQKAMEKKQHGMIVILERNYGFIRPDDGGQNIFFYRKALMNLDFEDLREGTEVTYIPVEYQGKEENRRMKAVAVEVIE
jgi:cold shock CspA family protein